MNVLTNNNVQDQDEFPSASRNCLNSSFCCKTGNELLILIKLTRRY